MLLGLNAGTTCSLQWIRGAGSVHQDNADSDIGVTIDLKCN